MSTEQVQETVGWTFMSTEPHPELRENGKLGRATRLSMWVYFCLGDGGSIDTDMVDMNVHPTGYL